MPTVRVIPLGGLGEIGMNALVLEDAGDAVVIDCGVTFDDRGLGIDVVHPDFSALESMTVRAVVVTHGHEDHIGALPYFLRRFDVPVYGPKYALGLVRERLGEHEMLAWAQLVEVRTREPFTVGPFTIEPVRVTHSIADATALVITSRAGTIVHTGDFKFDEAPPDGETFDEERLRAAGDAGVRLLLSDSTNVDARGESAGSEHGVGEALGAIVREETGAVVVAMFASNVHRLKMLGDIAQATGRKIVSLGRSVDTHTKVAHATGYLDWPGEIRWPSERGRELPREKFLGIATGTQGEARAALARLARGEHPAIDLGAGDTVVMSSRVIPGNEPEVYALMGDLVRRGVKVRSWLSDRGVHVSGHAHAGEQRRMIDLVRPRSFIPLHGTLHHLTRHAELARAKGIDDVHVIENGQIASLDSEAPELRVDGRVASGRVHVFAAKVVPHGVIKERSAIAAEGVAFVVVTLDASGKLIGEPTVATRGVTEEEESAALLVNARRAAREALLEVPKLHPNRADGASALGAARSTREADAILADAVRLSVRRVFSKALGFKPVTVVEVVRVATSAS